MAGWKRRQIDQDDRQRRPAILEDLAREKVDVFCWCNRCGHNATVAVAVLIGQLGPRYPVPEVGTRMRCTSCGSKDVATRPAWPSTGAVARH